MRGNCTLFDVLTHGPTFSPQNGHVWDILYDIKREEARLCFDFRWRGNKWQEQLECAAYGGLNAQAGTPSFSEFAKALKVVKGPMESINVVFEGIKRPIMRYLLAKEFTSWIWGLELIGNLAVTLMKTA